MAVNGTNGTVNGIPKDPTRFALWAVTGFLALLGLFFTTVNGVPWPSKELVANLQLEIRRLASVDDAQASRISSTELSLQSLQYENRQLRDHITWLEAELERVKAYVYPQPSGRAPRSQGPGRPPNALGPPQQKYP